MNKGFSIVEAMVIVTIIWILATIGYSRFNHHIAKTRQAEAKNNLHHLFSLQEVYMLEHNKYSWLKRIGLKKGGGYACSTTTPGEEMLNDLGFRPKNCHKLRYEYWMPAKHGDPTLPREDLDGTRGGTPRFIVRAENAPQRSGVYIWPDCQARDAWKVGNGGNVHQQFPNRQVLKACK